MEAVTAGLVGAPGAATLAVGAFLILAPRIVATHAALTMMDLAGGRATAAFGAIRKVTACAIAVYTVTNIAASLLMGET